MIDCCEIPVKFYFIFISVFGYIILIITSIVLTFGLIYFAIVIGEIAICSILLFLLIRFFVFNERQMFCWCAFFITIFLLINLFNIATFYALFSLPFTITDVLFVKQFYSVSSGMSVISFILYALHPTSKYKYNHDAQFLSTEQISDTIQEINSQKNSVNNGFFSQNDEV
jgi:hypothetical protein